MQSRNGEKLAHGVTSEATATVVQDTPRPSTRDRLLTAAYELLVRDGYQATTLKGVARRAGLTTGAIYGIFVNKQELMAHAVLNRWTQIQDEVSAIAASTGRWPDHPLVARIAQHLAAPPAPVHQLLTEVTGAVLREDGDTASPLQASIRMLAWVIRAAIDQAKADGAIDDRLATDALVALILNLYLGTITSKAWGIEQPAIEDVVDVLAAVNLGLAHGPERPPDDRAP